MASTRLERIGTILSRVEGLLTKGAMNPDDRPLWFDVYRAFPPITEPKFSKPKPEIKPIRQILYKEDAIRAKFHAQGHGLGAINMFNQTGETYTKKLVLAYQRLESEGVPDNELVQKAAETVGAGRQESNQPTQIKPTSPNSVTSQVLAEADLKNIFKE